MTPSAVQSVGADGVVVGGVLSILTGSLVAVALFPARSDTDADAVCAVPSPVIVVSAGASPASPDTASAAVQWIGTSPAYQPSGPGPVTGAPERVGGSVSTLMPLTVAVDVLPALSTAVPVTDWPAPLSDTVVAPGQLRIPDTVSEQVKFTVTGPSFQPAAFGAGNRDPVITGEPLSSLTVTEPVLVLPTASLATAALVTPAVSALCTSAAGVGPLVTPEPPSVADHAIATSELFQPAGFGEGVSAPVTTGPVLSRTNDAVRELAVPVQPFAPKLSKALAVTVCTPSPGPALSAKTQEPRPPPASVWLAVNTPLSWTHCVSGIVRTCRLSAAPSLA